jgi:predicted Rdx family selenoprotein
MADTRWEWTVAQEMSFTYAHDLKLVTRDNGAGDQQAVVERAGVVIWSAASSGANLRGIAYIQGYLAALGEQAVARHENCILA